MTDKQSDSSKDGQAAAGATVRIKLVKSIAGTRESHRATVRGLGLRKLNSESTLEDTPSVRGMIAAVGHLVRVVDDK